MISRWRDLASGQVAVSALKPLSPGRRRFNLDSALAGYSFVFPALVGLFMFGVVPLVYAFVVSLHLYDLGNPHLPFVGLSNYKALVDDQVFWTALRNTAVFAMMLVPLQTVTGLTLALLVQPSTRWIAVLRTSFYFPVVISYVVAAGVWELLFGTPNGPANSVLALVHIPTQLFFQSSAQALPLMALMSTWKWSGISMLIFLSGLHEIPGELYEAAQVDGAGAARQFWSITLPLLQRIALFVVVLNTIDAFKIFTPVYVITKGGPVDSTMVLVFYLFNEGFRYLHLGYASALSFAFLLLVLALAAVQFRLLRGEPTE